MILPDAQLISVEHARLKHLSRKQNNINNPDKTWNIKAAPAVARSRNPIRSTLSSITCISPQTSQPVINLGLGDPTHYPLHPAPPVAVAAVKKALDEGRSNGYLLGAGSSTARQAVADYHKRWDGVNYQVNDIVLTHGVGHALDLIFSVLFPPFSAKEPTNILLPRPGFSQYENLLENIGTEIRFYDCIEENGWEADLEMMESLCDAGTRAIMVTNPSNPCGSNFSRRHLEEILAIADRSKVPVIADEIYGHMTWTTPFIPMAQLSSSVPVITLSGLSKRFLLPGWRFGWVALHDPIGVAGAVKDGMAVWSNRFMGPSSLTQAALPAILSTSPEWFAEVLTKVQTAADIVSDAILSIPGLSCSKPKGALYVLVKVDFDVLHFQSDLDFCTALYREEAVFVLPGVCFEAPGYVRFVIASPEEVMRDVVERLARFCARHT